MDLFFFFFLHYISCWEKLLCVEESFSFVFSSTEEHWQGVDEVSGQRLRPCCFLHWSGTCLIQTQLIHMQPALLHLLQENLTNPKRPQMARKCFTHKQHCSPSIPDEHDAVISRFRQTENNALRHSPLTPSHQALPVPQKRMITAQPVAELYVLNIYLFIYFLLVLFVLKSSTT